MSAHLDKNLDKAYESFTLDHDALRSALMASLPESATQEKRSGVVMRLRRFPGGFTMNSKMTRLAAAAAIVIAVLLGFHYLGGSPIATSVAWAEVLKNMEAARTVTFTCEWDCGDGPEKAEVKIKEPYYRRLDRVSGQDRITTIFDLKQKQFVLLYPASKQAYLGDERDSNRDALLTYDGVKKDFRDGTEKYRGKTTIDGRDALCFQVSKEDRETTIWADAATSLPLRIERKAPSGRAGLSNIRFDVELNESLFDMTIPDDYIIINMMTGEVRIPFELTEKHLLAALSVFPKYLDGKFPTRFASTGRPGEEAKAKSSAERKAMVKANQPLADNLLLGAEFAQRLPQSSDWQYVGEDVKLGDATKAVCWWKPAGLKTYRVVYGDLSVRDVEPKDLPPIPWLVEQK